MLVSKLQELYEFEELTKMDASTSQEFASHALAKMGCIGIDPLCT